MITKIYKLLCGGMVSCAVCAALTACTDTWDDHYNSLGEGEGSIHEGTLWQAIKSDNNLSNFARVIEACDYAKSLNGSQVFTVFAPTNECFSAAEADALIASYKQQVSSKVVEEDNTVLKEFIQNHIALYNHSVSESSEDSITLMNGKYAVLNNNTIDGKPLLKKNWLYSNGVLYTLGEQVSYMPNVFEYLRKDADLDSLYSFLYNEKFYRREFMPSLSVPGSIVNGKTQYLDSVFRQTNELFDYINSELDSEDSTYVMVAPTNGAWRKLIEEYEPYFLYVDSVVDRDSMQYTNSRLAIIRGTTFSRTFNPSDEAMKDSAMSENCIRNYINRKLMWGAPFQYYQYNKPFESGGALYNTDVVQCSNGEVRKANEWNIDKCMGFLQWHIIEAESRNSVIEIQKVQNSKGEEQATIQQVLSYVNSDNQRFYDHVWSNAFVEFRPTITTTNVWVEFRLDNMLSNVGYDIYLVTVPAIAADTAATDQQRIPSKFRCSISGPGISKPIELTTPAGDLNFITTPDAIDYMLLAEDFKFPYSTYDIDEENMQMRLKLETKVTSSEQRNNKYTKVMRVDCILVVPHGTMQIVDELPSNKNIPEAAQGKPGVLMYPHGLNQPDLWWYKQR